MKRNLLRLLYQVVVYCDPEQLKPSDFVYLLASYGATLSECDQILYQVNDFIFQDNSVRNFTILVFFGRSSFRFAITDNAIIRMERNSSKQTEAIFLGSTCRYFLPFAQQKVAIAQ